MQPQELLYAGGHCGVEETFENVTLDLFGRSWLFVRRSGFILLCALYSNSSLNVADNCLKDEVIFKNLVIRPTSKKTQHFTITKINRLTLFKEIIAVYSENHTKHINNLHSVDKIQSY
jgi:hypothetical protein